MVVPSRGLEGHGEDRDIPRPSSTGHDPAFQAEVRAAWSDPSRRLAGRYARLGSLGSGGGGAVWRAWDAHLGRVVALKMLHGQRPSETALVRFVREARAMASLHHQGIVEIYDVGEHEGLPYIAMELVDGESLADRTAAGPLPPREAARIVRDASLAMAAAHGAGVLHRDLKPHNVLVARDGRAVVADFGLARAVTPDEAGSAITATGAILGTPAYMAPEQARSRSAEIGPRTDVYGLGAVLFEAITGRPPHVGPNPAVVLRSVLVRDAPSPAGLVPGVPRDLDSICRKALERAPSLRYASAEALAEDLSRFLDGSPILARPPGPIRRLGRAAARHRGPSIVVALVAAVGAGALGVAWRDSVRRTRVDEARAAGEAEARRDRVDELLARARAARGRPRAALALVREALELAPDHDRARALEVGMRQRASALDRADALLAAIPDGLEGADRVDALDRALAEAPEHRGARVERARTEIALARAAGERGRLDEARRRLAVALADVDALRELEGGESTSGSVVSVLIELAPIGLDPVLAAVEEALAARDAVARGGEEAERARVAGGELSPEGSLLLAWRRLGDGDGLGAEDAALAALDGSRAAGGRHDAAALGVLGRVRLRLRAGAGAVEALEAAVVAGADDVATLSMLGDALRLVGEPSRAADVYTRAVDRGPDRIEARLRRADLREHRGDLLAAAVDLEHAVRLGAEPSVEARLVALRARSSGDVGQLEGSERLGYYSGPRRIGQMVTRYEHVEVEGERRFRMTYDSSWGVGASASRLAGTFEFAEGEGEGPLRSLTVDSRGLLVGTRTATGRVEGGVLRLVVTTPGVGPQQLALEGADRLTLASAFAVERAVLRGEARSGLRFDATIFSPTNLRIERWSYECLHVDEQVVAGRPRRAFRFSTRAPSGSAFETVFDAEGRKLFGRSGIFSELSEAIDASPAAESVSSEALRGALVKRIEGDLPPPGRPLALRLTGSRAVPEDPGPGVTLERDGAAGFVARFPAATTATSAEEAIVVGESGGQGLDGGESPPPETRALVDEIIGVDRRALAATRRILAWTAARASRFSDHDPRLRPLLPKAWRSVTLDEERAVVAAALARAAGVEARAVFGFVLSRDEGALFPLWWVEVRAGERRLLGDAVTGALPASPERLALSRGPQRSLATLLSTVMTRVEPVVLDDDEGGGD